MPDWLDSFLGGPGAGPAIGYGLDLLFGDDPVQPGPVDVGNMGGAFGQMMTTAGQPGLGLWNQYLSEGAPEFDMKKQTRSIYNMMQELMQPERDRLREDTEARLFAQGRLGSSGGALELEALEQAFEEENLRQMLGAMGQAQSMQQQDFNQWLQGANLVGPQMMGLFSQIAPYKNFQEGWGKYNPDTLEPWDIWGSGFNKEEEAPGMFSNPTSPSGYLEGNTYFSPGGGG